MKDEYKPRIYNLDIGNYNLRSTSEGSNETKTFQMSKEFCLTFLETFSLLVLNVFHLCVFFPRISVSYHINHLSPIKTKQKQIKTNQKLFFEKQKRNN